VPPNRNRLDGDLLHKLYDVNFNQEIASLTKEATVFDVSVYGDGSNIKGVPMINTLGRGAHNSFARGDVFDCIDHCSWGGTNATHYILGHFLSLVEELENTEDKYVSALNNSINAVLS
jgi:hypothetical protein